MAGACLDLLGNAQPVIQVSSEDGTAESIGGVVGNGYRRTLVFIIDDTKNGSEDFLASNRHRIVDTCKDRRLNVPAAVNFLRTTTADSEACSFITSGPDICLHP